MPYFDVVNFASYLHLIIFEPHLYRYGSMSWEIKVGHFQVVSITEVYTIVHTYDEEERLTFGKKQLTS